MVDVEVPQREIFLSLGQEAEAYSVGVVILHGRIVITAEKILVGKLGTGVTCYDCLLTHVLLES